MNTKQWLIFSLIFILGFSTHSLFFTDHIKTVFSPEAEKEILSFIDGAQETIFIEVYVLTSEKVMEKLVEKAREGVEIRVLLEKNIKTNEKAYHYLTINGIKVRYSSQFKALHSKFIIVDGKKVLVGSHNLSNSALNENREASVIIEGRLVKEFLEIFNKDWQKAKNF